MMMVCHSRSLLTVELNIKQEEGLSPELREPMYIDLTLEDDEAAEVERGELIMNELESGSGKSSDSYSLSYDQSNLNDEGMTRHHEVLINSNGGRIVASRKSCQNAGGSLD